MRLTFCIQQNVSRFNVTMENAMFVCVMNRTRHFRNKFYRAPDRHGRTPDYFIKLAALDELHAEVARAFPLADFVDRNDTGVIQARSSFCLPAKALYVRFTRPWSKGNDFKRDCAIEAFLSCAKYYALTATTDLFQQFIVSQISHHIRQARVPARVVLCCQIRCH